VVAVSTPCNASPATFTPASATAFVVRPVLPHDLVDLLLRRGLGRFGVVDQQQVLHGGAPRLGFRLRAICLALPETTERPSHGEPTFFIRDKKVFVSYADHHHDDRLGFWRHAPAGAQQAVVEADPERYFVPPYVRGRGWIGVYLDVPGVDWDEIAELVEDAYRMVAPKRLITELDRSRAGRR